MTDDCGGLTSVQEKGGWRLSTRTAAKTRARTPDPQTPNPKHTTLRAHKLGHPACPSSQTMTQNPKLLDAKPKTLGPQRPKIRNPKPLDFIETLKKWTSNPRNFLTSECTNWSTPRALYPKSKPKTSGPRRTSLLDLSRRTVNFRRPERARSEEFTSERTSWSTPRAPLRSSVAYSGRPAPALESSRDASFGTCVLRFQSNACRDSKCLSIS